MAVLGLRFCARVFSSCSKWGPLFITVHRPLTIAASLVVEHRLQTHRLSNCGSRAQLLRGMWDLPRLGPEPMSPALAGRFSTTAPPGKPKGNIFNLTVQYLEKYSSTSYITASFTLASGHPGLEIKILYYCTLYSTVQYSTQKHSHLQRMHAGDNVCQTREITYMIEHANARLPL